MLTWTFDEDCFQLIPVLRDWLNQQCVQYIEEGFRHYSEIDSEQAYLLRFTGGTFEDVKVLEADCVFAHRCSVCGLAVKRVTNTPRLRIAFPKSAPPSLFWVPDADIKIASEGFLNALENLDLDAGLATFPVEVEGSDSEPYFALYSTVNLGWPAAPWGFWGNICQHCQRSIRRSLWPDDPRMYPALPRYSFYYLFQRPGGKADWMWTELYGQNELFVSEHLRDWLQTEAMDHFGFPLEPSQRFNFVACGWYPDEVAEASLPKPYRGLGVDPGCE
jgi:hypothetical protein